MKSVEFDVISCLCCLRPMECSIPQTRAQAMSELHHLTTEISGDVSGAVGTFCLCSLGQMQVSGSITLCVDLAPISLVGR